MSINEVCQVFVSTKGKEKLFKDGYTFNRNNQNGKRCYWQCELFKSKNCPVRVTILMENLEYKIMSQSKDHNHDPESLRIAFADFINELKPNRRRGKSVS